MPNLTVSGNVDTMLGAADNAAIRSAIGLGQTDAPTLSGLTLTSGVLTILSGNSTGNLSVIGSWIRFGGGISLGGFDDAALFRDAAGILAQRNGTNKQVHRVYNTFLGTTANEWGGFDWLTTANTLRIGTEHGGTGAARPIDFVTGGVAKWQISAAGHLMSAGVTDNLYDIGANGANRPRNVYAGTVVTAPTVSATNFLSTNSGGAIDLGADHRFRAPSSGVLKLSNNAETDFNRLQLGNTTDAFPAIARDGAGIKFTGAATGSTSWIKVPAVAVASLPAASTAGVGARSFVNDALSPVFGSAVTAGGSATVPVYSTGSAWNVG